MMGWPIAIGNFTKPLIFLPYSAEELAAERNLPPIDEDRTCIHCGITKPIHEFVRRGYSADGGIVYRHHCKKCATTKPPKIKRVK